ncbi:GNAT family N-acetyltransferase [Desulfogranum japonicum]|uniref:GNAT family N-acetyltransferase n=1 Tax=Desulfogranum japonicum TaxID=231447 RepID=UPI0005560C0E|nr:GNAT family N-acetyltransferase [Desulfogranum japonicum]
MTEKDIESVVEIHLSSFPSFFLTFLGPGFLKIFYKGICSASDGIAFISLDSKGTPAGFVVGTSNPRGFYTKLLKSSWYKFALASVIPIIKKPSIFFRVARGLKHPGDNPIGTDIAGLFSIGILPEVQRQGVGQKLIKAFLDGAKEKGCNKVFLTTDRDENANVNAFYQKVGFDIQRQYITPEGRRMNEYIITI